MVHSKRSSSVSLLFLCISTVLASFYDSTSVSQARIPSSSLSPSGARLSSRLRGGSASLPHPANSSGWLDVDEREQAEHAEASMTHRLPSFRDEDPTESDGKQRASIVYEGIRPSISLRDAWHSPSTEPSAPLDPQVQLKWHNQLMKEAKQMGKLQDHRSKEGRRAAARFDSAESYDSELQHSSSLRARSEERESLQQPARRPSSRREGSSTEASSTILRFKVDVLGLREGEEVLVVGNHGKLGSWDPDRGLELSSEGDRKEWRGEVELMLPGDLVAYEYKYVVRSGKEYRWEVKIPNRKVTIPSDFFGMIVVVQDGTFNMMSPTRVLLPQPREDPREDAEDFGREEEEAEADERQEQAAAGAEEGEGRSLDGNLEARSWHTLEREQLEEASGRPAAATAGAGAAEEEQEAAEAGGEEEDADEKTLLQRELEVTRSKLSLMLSMVDSLQDARELLVAKSIEIDSLKAQLARERGENVTRADEGQGQGQEEARMADARAAAPPAEARMLLRDQKEEIDILEQKLVAVELERDKYVNETKTLRAQIELLTEALCQAEEDQQMLNAELEKEIAKSRRLRSESEQKMKEIREDAEEAEASRVEAIKQESATAGQTLQERLKELEGTESELRAELHRLKGQLEYAIRLNREIDSDKESLAMELKRCKMKLTEAEEHLNMSLTREHAKNLQLEEVLKLKESDTSLIQNLSSRTHELERRYEKVMTERDEMEQELLELQRQQAKLERKKYAETIRSMQEEIKDLHVLVEVQRVEMGQQLATMEQEASLLQRNFSSALSSAIAERDAAKLQLQEEVSTVRKWYNESMRNFIEREKELTVQYSRRLQEEEEKTRGSNTSASLVEERMKEGSHFRQLISRSLDLLDLSIRRVRAEHATVARLLSSSSSSSSSFSANVTSKCKELVVELEQVLQKMESSREQLQWDVRGLEERIRSVERLMEEAKGKQQQLELVSAQIINGEEERGERRKADAEEELRAASLHLERRTSVKLQRKRLKEELTKELDVVRSREEDALSGLRSACQQHAAACVLSRRTREEERRAFAELSEEEQQIRRKRAALDASVKLAGELAARITEVKEEEEHEGVESLSRAVSDLYRDKEATRDKWRWQEEEAKAEVLSSREAEEEVSSVIRSARSKLQMLKSQLGEEVAKHAGKKEEAEVECGRLLELVRESEDEKMRMELELKNVEERAMKGLIARETIIKIATAGRDKAAKIQADLTAAQQELEEARSFLERCRGALEQAEERASNITQHQVEQLEVASQLQLQQERERRREEAVLQETRRAGMRDVQAVTRSWEEAVSRLEEVKKEEEAREEDRRRYEQCKSEMRSFGDEMERMEGRKQQAGERWSQLLVQQMNHSGIERAAMARRQVASHRWVSVVEEANAVKQNFAIVLDDFDKTMELQEKAEKQWLFMYEEHVAEERRKEQELEAVLQRRRRSILQEQEEMDGELQAAALVVEEEARKLWFESRAADLRMFESAEEQSRQIATLREEWKSWKQEEEEKEKEESSRRVCDQGFTNKKVRDRAYTSLLIQQSKTSGTSENQTKDELQHSAEDTLTSQDVGRLLLEKDERIAQLEAKLEELLVMERRKDSTDMLSSLSSARSMMKTLRGSMARDQHAIRSLAAAAWPNGRAK